MTNDTRIKYLKKMIAQIESHQVAREVDLELEIEKGVTGLDKLKFKADKTAKIQSHKNYLDTVKDQIETDKRAIALIERMLKKLEGK